MPPEQDPGQATTATATDRKDPPPPPAPSDSLRAYTQAWWDRTRLGEDMAEAARQYQRDLKDLFPDQEARRAKEPGQERSDAEKRRVQVAHVYRYAQQATALLAPHDHGFRFKARPGVPASDSQEDEAIAAPSKEAVQLARTLTLMVRLHLKECCWQDVYEEWVQSGQLFPFSVAKLTFQREFMTSPLAAARPHDLQDELAELQALQEAFLTGEFQQDDARFEQMVRLEETVRARAGDVRVYQGLTAHWVPCDQFGVDPAVRSVSGFYAARWMFEDRFLSGGELLARFPYKLERQPDGSERPTGVHPELLAGVSYTGQDGQEITPSAAERDESLGRFRQGTLGELERRRYKVREVWAKCEGRILWLCQGVDYPIAELIPRRRPQCWYPFVPIVQNRAPLSWCPVSDTELTSPIQDRINTKASDCEWARNLSLPRLIYNKLAVQDLDMTNVGTTRPGQAIGVALSGDQLDHNTKWLSYEYPRDAFDDSADRLDLQNQMGLPRQLMGETGGAKFSSEVQVAHQGLQISTDARLGRVLRPYEQVLTMAAEMLLQEYRLEQVREMVGEHAYWPTLVDEEELSTAQRQLMGEAWTSVAMDIQTTGARPEDPARVAKDRFLQGMIERFGSAKPLTRTTLFRQLEVEVEATANERLDRQRRYASLKDAGATLAALGVRLRPKAAARLLADLLDERDAMEELVVLDAGQAVADLLAAIQQSGPPPPEQMAALVQVLGPLLAQAAAVARQTPGGDAPAGGGGAPPGSPAP